MQIFIFFIINLFFSFISYKDLSALDFYTISTKKNYEIKHLYSPKFETIKYNFHDIINLTNLISKFKFPNDKLSFYIRSLLSKKTLNLINDYKMNSKNKKNDENLKKNLIIDLNNLLNKKDFYNPKYFNKIKISKKMQNLIKKNMTKQDYLHLNNYLLQKSYPKSISSWFFNEKNNLDPKNYEIYKNPKEAYWKRKIIFNKLPYKYIEKNKKKDTLLKKEILELNIFEKTFLLQLKGSINPETSKYTYNYNFDNTIKNKKSEYISIKAKINGIKVANRINLNVKILLKNLNNLSTKKIDGSISFKLYDKNIIRYGKLVAFAQILNKKNIENYIRILGNITGTIKYSNLNVDIINNNGKLLEQFKGKLNQLYKILLIK